LRLLEILTGAIHDLGAVQTENLNANANFARLGLGNGQVLEFEYLGSPRRLKMTLLAVLTDDLSSARSSREHDNSGYPHLMRQH